jgi:hypothetical protein
MSGIGSKIGSTSSYVMIVSGAWPGALGGTRTPNLLTLLCLSRTGGEIHRPGELPVEFAGDVALEAAADLPRGLSLGGAPGDVTGRSGRDSRHRASR